MATNDIPRVMQVGTRKGNRPVINCPACGYRVALNRKDVIDSHDRPIGHGGRLARCSMSGKAVHLHRTKLEEQDAG